MAAFLTDPDVTIHQGDALTVLRDLPTASVDCVVTSPPYYGLRDYGVEGQIGLESDHIDYGVSLVSVLTDARRVLADTGTLWLNLGDTYRDQRLLGVPWMVAFALGGAGWRLRSEVIWEKPNPMPESVKTRPSRSHEHVFMFSKTDSYYFDQEASREPFSTKHAPGRKVTETFHYGADTGGNTGLTAQLEAVKERLRAESRPQDETLEGMEPEAPRGPDGRRRTHVKAGEGSIQHRDGERWPHQGRNIRTVWTIPTENYPGAHFAVMPEELARRCIVAGCPPGGTVLDPFGGAGTTAVVARKNQRNAVLIELNTGYCQIAADRLQQQSLFA